MFQRLLLGITLFIGIIFCIATPANAQKWLPIVEGYIQQSRLHPPDSVFKDFKSFLARLWARYPKTEVFFMSVPHAPRREQYWPASDQLNAKIMELSAQERGLYYVDIVKDMYGPDGKVREELYKKDRLHMNRLGQMIWITKIKTALNR